MTAEIRDDELPSYLALHMAWTSGRGVEAGLRAVARLAIEHERAKRTGDDAELLDWLIENAATNPDDDADDIGLVIGDGIKWPDGVRAAIRAAKGK